MAFFLLYKLRLILKRLNGACVKNLVNLSRVTKVSTIFFVFLSGFYSKAQIIGPSVTEVKYNYTATFEIPVGAEEKSDDERAHLHASHLFGLFHTPALVSQMGLPEGAGGIGAPRSQMKIKILSSVVVGGIVKVKYFNSGKMLLHKTAAKKLLADGIFEVPMPTNPYLIYDQKCTDEHYDSFGDYWYFYDIFKDGCQYLSKAPYAQNVKISIKSSEYSKMQQTAQLPQLRGNNGNGDLFSVYVIHGFESDPKDKEDSGRINYEEFNEYLRQNNFAEDRVKSNRNSKLLVYTKDINLDNGKTIKVEIKHLLVATEIDSRSKVFAKFFKEAVETADVIIYGGHSGLGGNLDIPLLQEKAGQFQFNAKKKQIFFFDSCSSYSYYLEHFAVEKTKAKIDIVSYGLSSYFYTSNNVLSRFMDQLLSEKSTDVLWSDVLSTMENELQGDTYLLSVGGI